MSIRKDFGVCPTCRTRIDGHDFAGTTKPEAYDGREPQADDVLVCAYCATILIVERDGITLRVLDVHELTPVEAAVILTVRDVVIRNIRRRSALEN